MIRCTLELIPGGVGEPERLGVIDIDNQVLASINTSGKRGDYRFRLQKKRQGRVVNQGIIYSFPRQSYHPWNLVRMILNEAAEKSGGTI